MESFIHLRKGTTPRRLHADLNGLKDDELGRGGFTGRTANLYRRNDPTAYRSSGPLRPVDVLALAGQELAGAKIDAVVHFAAKKAVGESVAEPLLYYGVNVGGLVTLAEAMRDHGCRTFVFSSSASQVCEAM